MRLIPLCLMGLLALATIPAAEASPNRQEGRVAASAKAGNTGKAAAAAPRSAARQAAPAQRSASAASRRAPAAAATRPASSRAAPARRNAPVLQRTASRGAAARVTAPRSAAPTRSWQSGLPQASGEQRECPVGTMSTLARGHDDVVRCLPL